MCVHVYTYRYVYTDMQVHPNRVQGPGARIRVKVYGFCFVSRHMGSGVQGTALAFMQTEEQSKWASYEENIRIIRKNSQIGFCFRVSLRLSGLRVIGFRDLQKP